MKVYLDPGTTSRGINRVVDALKKYAPPEIEIVDDPKSSDLEIIHVFGRHDSIERRVNKLVNKRKPYVMIQYCLRSTMNPHASDWIKMWSESRFVWSYYDLPNLCREDSLATEYGDGSAEMEAFPFYHAPLGVDTDIFYPRTFEKKYTVLSTSQHALSEGTRECAFATKNVDGKMIFIGHELRRGSNIVCKSNVSDEELARYYSESMFISGLRRKEGFELPVIEGAMCGSRPIVFDRPEMRKWFGDFAIFIPEGPREEVINNLTEIFNQKFPPVRFSDRMNLIKRFSWETIIGNFWKKLL